MLTAGLLRVVNTPCIEATNEHATPDTSDQICRQRNHSGLPPGDSVRVHTLIKRRQGARSDIRGRVHRRRSSSACASFTVRRFRWRGCRAHLPAPHKRIERIEIVQRGCVRVRAQLLRDLRTRGARSRVSAALCTRTRPAAAWLPKIPFLLRRQPSERLVAWRGAGSPCGGSDRRPPAHPARFARVLVCWGVPSLERARGRGAQRAGVWEVQVPKSPQGGSERGEVAGGAEGYGTLSVSHVNGINHAKRVFPHG